MSVGNPALRYYGAKFRLGGWISSLFPEHVSYIEPFGGAAGVLLRKKPSQIEVFNDLDGAVVNFFRVLRQRPSDLIRQLKRTPFSRAEFEESFDTSPDPLEDARRFFVSSWQGYGGARAVTTGWKMQKRVWLKSRANQLVEWHAGIRNLAIIARRFATVQVECDNALKVIQNFDSLDTLFYLDPSYPTDLRNVSWCQKAYKHEFSTSDHVHLLNLIRRVKGRVVISSYDNDLYCDRLKDWHRLEKTSQTMNKTVAKEVVWLNYEL